MTTTAERIIAELSIPNTDWQVLCPGVTIVKKTWDAAIRAAYSGQKWYIDWLDRKYEARRSRYNSLDYAWVVGRPSSLNVLGSARPGVVDWSPSTALKSPHFSYEEVSNDGVLGLQFNGDGIVSAIHGHDGGTYYADRVNMTGAQPNTTWIRSPSNHRHTARAVRRMFGSAPAGRSGLYVGSPLAVWSVAYDGAMPIAAGFLGVSLRSAAMADTFHTPSFTPASPADQGWMLLTGPAALSRGEIYSPTKFWFAAETSEVALLLETQRAQLTDPNERARLQLEIDKTRLRVHDLFVHAQLSGLDPWKMYPPTFPDAAALASQTDVVEGINFATVNAFLGSGAPFTTVVTDFATPDVLSAGLLETSKLVLVDGTTGAWAAGPISGTIAELENHVRRLRLARVVGSSLTVSPAITDAFIQGQYDAAMSVLTSPTAPQPADLFSVASGDSGSIGLAAIAAASAPLTPGQRSMVELAVRPSALEFYRS